MANTLDKIRSAIAEHEEKLAELRAALKVVEALNNEPASSISINHAIGTTTTHQTTPHQTISAAIMAALSDRPKNLGAILESVNATGKNVTDQSISSALQILKKKNLVVRKGRMWRHR